MQILIWIKKIIIFDNSNDNELKHKISEKYPNIKYELVLINHITRGQVETVLHARHLVRPENPLLIYNIDTHFTSTRLKSKILTLENRNMDGLLGCYESSDKNLSFIKLDENGFVEEVKEKIMGADQSAVNAWANAEKMKEVAVESTQGLVQKDLLLDWCSFHIFQILI